MGLDGSSSNVKFKGLDLPSEWKICKLQDLFSIQQGKALSKKYRNGKSPFPFLRTANILWGKLELIPLDEMDFTEQERERYALMPGDLLVCEGGDIGRTAIWNGEIQDCYFQNHIHRLRTDRDYVVPRFYMYWMQAAIKQLRLYTGEGNITTIANLSKSRLGSFIVPLPPLKEQSAISGILSLAQEAIEATEKVISATKELKKSLMQYLFTYGPVPVDQADQVPLKETEIGMIPEHWEVALMINVCEKPQYGYTASAMREVVGPKYLRITDIQEENVSWESVPYCICSEEEYKKYCLKPNDIVVARIGATTGKTYIVKESVNAVYASYLIRIRARDIRPGFLAQYLKSRAYWIQIDANKGGRLKQGINIPVLENILIPIPQLVEQDDIVKILTTIDGKIEKEQIRKIALDNLFHTMLHHLMTGKIRVKDIELPDEIGVS